MCGFRAQQGVLSLLYFLLSCDLTANVILLHLWVVHRYFKTLAATEMICSLNWVDGFRKVPLNFSLSHPYGQQSGVKHCSVFTCTAVNKEELPGADLVPHKTTFQHFYVLILIKGRIGAP